MNYIFFFTMCTYTVYVITVHKIPFSLGRSM